MRRVAVILGSDSDIEEMKGCVEALKKFGVEYEVDVISAHRSPEKARDFAQGAAAKGIGVIVAAAGGAAHLAGVIASMTTLPVIGVPMQSKLSGLDSLLSIVQMPPGVPVATVGVGGGQNAGLLAVQILALSEPSLADKLAKFKQDLAAQVDKKAARAKQEMG